MEDIQIGRESLGGEQTVSVPTAAFGGFISANRNRIALVVYPVATNTIFVTTNPSQTAATGIRVNDATGPLVMELTTHGALMQKQWFAMTSGGQAEPVTYTEATLERQ